jgi:hypothetical protein
MRSFLLSPLLALVLAAACAGEATDETGTPAEPEPVELHVRQLYDMTGGAYVEGAYSFVRLERSDDGEVVAEKRLEEGRQLEELIILSETTLTLEPGSYRLVSYQRPCSGNCGTLDPPTDECSATLEVAAGRSVDATITVLPAKSCSIEIR